MRIALALLLFGLPRIVAAADHVPATAPAKPVPPTAVHEALPFIEDDYPRALAEARTRKVPLFVDSWATWCHTCRFMRAYVFTDPMLAKQSKRFVWLSIDTEKEQNAAFLGKYPVDVYPTLMVIDPARETAVLRWPSSANATQLVKLLDDGERAAHGGGDAGARERARADRLAGERKWHDAAAAYRMALPLLPAIERSRVIESLVGALAFAHEDAACGRAAQELIPAMPRGPSFANATMTGLGCALGDKGDDGAAARAALTPLAEEAVALPGLLADDRSGLFEELVEARGAADDAGGKRAMAQRWLIFLEGEAARAPGPEQRAVFDPHRVNAALAMDEPMRAEAALKASEHDLPGDYNAPARLALIYRAAKRYDDGLAAIDRAIPKAYGPRTLRLYDLKADLQRDKGDRAGAKRTLEQALTTAAGLPTEQRRPQQVAQLQQKLDALH
jgi:thiol-disulfide isomerase/thioredoxin